MLIEFAVKNYRSISAHEFVRLDMRSNVSIKESPNNTASIDAPNHKRILKAAIIFGTNSMGKSNLLRALWEMREVVLVSHGNTYGDTLPFDPFLLDDESSELPTEFYLEFLSKDVLYTFEFALRPERIIYERLHSYPKNTKRLCYERSFNGREYSWKFGTNFGGDNESIQKRTLENTLFLSKSAQENHPETRPLIDYFLNKLVIIFGSGNPGRTRRTLKTEEGRLKISEFLRRADVGIEELLVERRNVSEVDFPDFISETARRKILSDDRIQVRTMSAHKIPKSKKIVQLDFQKYESEGTKKLFNLSSPILEMLATGGTFIIDEIESNLHFQIVNGIVEIFHKNNTGAQLITTSHNPIILENELRRDQLFFASKNELKSTIIYNLSKIQKFDPKFKAVRKGSSLLRGYLDQKFFEPIQLEFDYYWPD